MPERCAIQIELTSKERVRMMSWWADRVSAADRIALDVGEAVKECWYLCWYKKSRHKINAIISIEYTRNLMPFPHHFLIRERLTSD
jgi:hypothetical protein